MFESKDTVKTQLPISEYEVAEFEKLGFNREFLETETGRAVAHAISILQVQASYSENDEETVEHTLSGNTTGKVRNQDFRD